MRVPAACEAAFAGVVASALRPGERTPAAPAAETNPVCFRTSRRDQFFFSAIGCSPQRDVRLRPMYAICALLQRGR